MKMQNSTVFLLCVTIDLWKQVVGCGAAVYAWQRKLKVFVISLQ